MELQKNVDKSKCKGTFDFIEDPELKDICYNFIAYVVLLFEECHSCDEESLIEIKTHTISLYLGAILEAITLHFCKKKIINQSKRRKYTKDTHYTPVQELTNLEGKLFICELVEDNYELKDGIPFKNLINGLKDNKILSEDSVNKLDQIRKYRNNIHINVYKDGDCLKFDDLSVLFNDFKDIINEIEDNY